MKKSSGDPGRLFLLFVVAIGVMAASCGRGPDVASGSAELAMKSTWVTEHLTGTGQRPPFSFQYGGKASADLLQSWPKRTWIRKAGGSVTEIASIWTDPETGLEVRCTAKAYRDYPVVEWTVRFKNNGAGNTPVIRNIQGIDVQFESASAGGFVLHGNKGDWCVAESYEPWQKPLEQDSAVYFAPVGGRATNGPGGWPYFNLQMPGGGVMLAVGWPGQWAASFTRHGVSGVHVTAGQEVTNLSLKPGEVIRSPLIALHFWKGTDVVRSQNLWRRWMTEHNLPRTADNKPPVPMYIFCSGAFYPGLNVSEASERQFIDTLVKQNIKVDYWWMDAGWYPCKGQWWNTGTWEVDATRFPDGIKAVSDYAHSKDMKLILWMEPERVGDQASWLAVNHPEWLLGGTLLNMGNPDALAWVTGHVDSLITEQGIDLYRQDYNIDPLNYWRANDPADRQGITENLYVQGYLAYWDELRRRHPGMLIDACASGGRRNDLETMRRAVPLLRSDYQAFDGNLSLAIGNQGHTYGLSSWLPFYGQGVYQNEGHMDYYVKSHMSPSFGICLDVRKPGINWDEYRRLTEQWQTVAGCMSGDYYPLTPYSLRPDKWIAWQFDRPAEGDGIIQAFRRDSCSEAAVTLRLCNLSPGAGYEITNPDREGHTVMQGKDLMEKGLPLEITDRPGAAIISYRKLR